MTEEYNLDDPTPLIAAASEFASHPGSHADTSVKDFLDRFPLPVILTALQLKGDLPGLENTLAACLEKVFKTKYGASLIPQYMQFVQVGLMADSQLVRSLACKTVICLLENLENDTDFAAQLIKDSNVYPLLLDCLINGNEQVATASVDAILKLASCAKGLEIIFPASKHENTDLGILSSQCSSLGRVRIMGLLVKLFSVSSSVASAIHRSNLLSLIESEVRNADDTLVTLSVLELLYELAQVEHAAEYLSRTKLLQLLSSIISNNSMDSIVRSRAMMISGRLLSNELSYSHADESAVKNVISAIYGRLESLESQDKDESETALEAFGQIGSSTHGATLLLSNSSPAVRLVIDAVFDRQGRGRKLAALHALANIAGETRAENYVTLNADVEENLRRLIYEVASRSPKLTPSGFFLSTLQQDPEIRLAGYRVISGLVARPWCLMEICSKQEIIDIVTDPTNENTKIGMEVRYNCCKSIHKSLMQSKKITSDAALARLFAKLQEAISRGPYVPRKHSEAQPVVQTAERF